MFKKTFFIACTFFFIALLWLCLPLLRVGKEDIAAYQQLEKESSQKKEGSALTHFSKEIREHVVKEIWLHEKESKTFRIVSEESELFFIHDEKKMEIIEQLKDVKCFLKDEKDSFRYLEAREACFNYQSQLFIASDVKIWKYPFCGKELPHKQPETAPLMSGTCESVEFILDGEHEFRAQGLKITFDPKVGAL